MPFKTEAAFMFCGDDIDDDINHLIVSMQLVTHILRTHECLSSTYHRLLIFGLVSGTDIISSVGYLFSFTMVPKEMNYFVPFVSSNIATCNAKGGFHQFCT